MLTMRVGTFVLGVTRLKDGGGTILPEGRIGARVFDGGVVGTLSGNVLLVLFRD